MTSIAVVQLESLKTRHPDNRVLLHLANVAISCKIRSRAYWDMNLSLTRSMDYISIPLLFISSATGLTSALQMLMSTAALQVIVVIFGVSTAFMSGLQKYFRYAERAENAKYIAKRYERVAKHIQHRLILLEKKPDHPDVNRWMYEIENDVDNLIAEAHECLPRHFFKPFQTRRVEPLTNLEEASKETQTFSKLFETPTDPETGVGGSGSGKTLAPKAQ